MQYSTPENLKVIYEDNHIIVVNKRVGDIVQGDKTGDIPLSETVKSYIKKKYKKPGKVFLGVVHRLDRPTSGLVLFARTSKALARMNKMFQDKKVHKTYWALVYGTPKTKSKKLEHWLKRNPRQNKSYAHSKIVKDSKKAILQYKTLAELDTYCLLEIILETGRHHQIRSQLSAIGHPIKGDLKYGAKRSNPDGGIHLHAHKLTFVHPVSKENIELIAETPNEKLWNLF